MFRNNYMFRTFILYATSPEYEMQDYIKVQNLGPNITYTAKFIPPLPIQDMIYCGVTHPTPQLGLKMQICSWGTPDVTHYK